MRITFSRELMQALRVQNAAPCSLENPEAVVEIWKGAHGPEFTVFAGGKTYTGFLDLFHLSDPKQPFFQVVLDPVLDDEEPARIRAYPDGRREFLAPGGRRLF